jgi:hypothetical protein
MPRKKVRPTDPPVAERPIEPYRIERRIIFAPEHFTPLLSPDDTCGDLIDRLISLCLSRPEFLRPESSDRYVQMLPSFKAFTFTAYGGPAMHARETQFAQGPIKALRWAMGEWVFSYLSKEHHPMLASFALDVSQFIARMVQGYAQHDYAAEGHPVLEVKPVVQGVNEKQLISLDLDTKFKSDFTRNNLLRKVICRIPEDGAVRFQNGHVIGPGAEFGFRTNRCYLSTGFYDHIRFKCQEPRRFDIQNDFQLFGQIDPEDGHEQYDLSGQVPAHWIVAAIRWESNGTQEVEARLPLPFANESQVN